MCSDDGDVLRHVTTLLPHSQVVSASSVPASRGVPYQADFHPTAGARWKLAMDTLADLIALGSGSEVIFPEISNCGARYSGFSLLARDLAARPDIVDGLPGGRSVQAL